MPRVLSGADQRYSAEVMARVKDPQRVGGYQAAPEVGTGERGALESGTVARIQVRVIGRQVVGARFKVFGCSAAIASASLVAEWLEGSTVDEGRLVTAERVAAALDLAPERVGVARLVVDAAHAAIADVDGKRLEGLKD